MTSPSTSPAWRVARRLASILFATTVLGASIPAVSAQQVASEPRQTTDTHFTISPRAYAQIDWRGYPDWTVTAGTGRLDHDTIEVRRLRAGVDGRWRQLTYELTVDPQDADGTLVKDAYGQWRFTRALRLRVGQFKVPGGREYQVSARSLDFMERTALAESISAGRDMGGMITGEVGAELDYQVGVFAGDGNGRSSRSGLTMASRVLWSPVKDLEIGGSFSQGKTKAIDAEAANGLDGRDSSGYRFFDRVYVQGRRTRAGMDAEWSPGPWRFTVETMFAHDTRVGQGLDLEDLPSVIGLGWNTTATREFGRRRGKGQKRSRIREFDLGLRFDALAFDDNGPSTVPDSVRLRATNIRPRAAQILTAGVSWSPTPWMRLLGNASVDRYTEARSAPAAGRRGNYWMLGSRLQVELP